MIGGVILLSAILFQTFAGLGNTRESIQSLPM